MGHLISGTGRLGWSWSSRKLEPSGGVGAAGGTAAGPSCRCITSGLCCIPLHLQRGCRSKWSIGIWSCIGNCFSRFSWLEHRRLAPVAAPAVGCWQWCKQAGAVAKAIVSAGASAVAAAAASSGREHLAEEQAAASREREQQSVLQPPAASGSRCLSYWCSRLNLQFRARSAPQPGASSANAAAIACRSLQKEQQSGSIFIWHLNQQAQLQ